MKNVLIFGATGGIGESVARLFASKGYSIGIHYVGNKDKANTLSNEFNKSGAKNIIVEGDISDENQVIQIYKKTKKALGSIDVVINTAGIMKLSPIKTLDLNIFDDIIRINVRGAFIASKYALEYLSKEGSLLNFSTTVTRAQTVNYGAYAASKSAVETMTLILAREAKGINIRINAIAPGPVATPLFTAGKTDEQIKAISQLNPMERIGMPDDIAEAVFSIISSKWINGQVIFVNGGMA
ncbi:Short-chain type dehydrogenase/reductase [Alteracholeplasma palmae J233]|uniref:Short-chain type dehydrogenase/reductase n=1 Tax=Alteracholeplasma palmae (strain ATCC 49389 / J233) TaxID=1318466 RepID=U4KQ18_ALTPJ|nr:SDR family oxidoreductase [Alteracholeplasma palmae]CCV64395.1 Short-chain type dehydrogenase/reductase [Alteracholeplasma palmae J233]